MCAHQPLFFAEKIISQTKVVLDKDSEDPILSNTLEKKA